MSAGVNPYAAPSSDSSVDDEHDEGDGRSSAHRDASKAERMANFCADTACRSAVLIVLSKLSGEGLVAVLFFWAGYYILFEWAFGRTPGKWLTGTRVVTNAGKRPRFGQIVGRTLSRYVPFEPFSFLGRSRRGWHDRWSGTRVVRVSRRRNTF